MMLWLVWMLLDGISTAPVSSRWNTCQLENDVSSIWGIFQIHVSFQFWKKYKCFEVRMISQYEWNSLSSLLVAKSYVKSFEKDQSSCGKVPVVTFDRSMVSMVIPPEVPSQSLMGKMFLEENWRHNVARIPAPVLFWKALIFKNILKKFVFVQNRRSNPETILGLAIVGKNKIWVIRILTYLRGRCTDLVHSTPSPRLS